MTKGTSIVHLYQVIDELIELGHSVKDNTFKFIVKSKYNKIFQVQSNTTKISNLREKAIEEHSTGGYLINVDRDGNGMDFIRATLTDGKILFQVWNQKGNSGSLNANSSKSVKLHSKSFIEEDKIKSYFDRFPDDINPDKTGYDYDVDVFLGYYSAIGDGNLGDIPIYGSENYFKKVGVNETRLELDKWVYDRIKNEIYDAGATDFDEVYLEIIKKY